MYSRSSNTDALITAIDNFPTEWALTPCKGKANQWKNWPHERLERNKLIEAIRTQKNAEGKHTSWTGVSIVTGPMSGGIMAVDFDGGRALQKYTELSGGKLPPTTKKWTSGKPGHFQILLQVPPAKWEGLQPKKIDLENGEKLELRWNQCSTLPPSIHPDTGKPYIWKNDGEIAEAPDFILQLMKESPAVALPKTPAVQTTQYIDTGEQKLGDFYRNEILLSVDAASFYGNWVALEPSGTNKLRGLCPFHEEKTPSFIVSKDSNLWKCFGKCDTGGGPAEFLDRKKGGDGNPRGKYFVEIVRELTEKWVTGVQMPEFHPKTQNLKSKIQNPKSNNLLKHPANYTPEPAAAAEIIEHADNLLQEELTPTNQIIGAIAAAKRAGLSPKNFREILAEWQAEQELDWSILDSVAKFKQLHQIQNTPINLHEFFPHDFAKALLSKAESDRVDPVRIVQSLLPIIGTMLGGRVGIEIKPGEEEDDAWVEYPIINTMDVGYASTGKTATSNSLLKPLKKMQAAEQERLDEVLDELVQLEEAWKEMSKEERAEKAESDENPRVFNEKHCKPKKWIINPQRASAQAITKRIAEQEPKHGCLLMQDELSGLFASLDQFTGGNSGQRQFLLEAWNGRLEGSVDRVDLKSDSYTFKDQTVSITGSIQPDIARRIFNMTSDPDGMLSRFLPAVAGIPDNFAQRPTVRVSLNRMMTEVIKGLERIPDTLLTMPARTADIYWDYWEKLRHTQEISFGDNPAFSQFVGKQQSYVGRFAILLHCLENLGTPEIPSRVTPETMHKAVRLSLFYCNQFLLLQSKSAQQQPLEGILLDILKFAQQQGGQLSTRQLCQSRFKRLQVEGKKFSAYFAQKFLQAIADAGYGTFQEKTLSLLPLLPFVAGGVTALKPIDSKDLSPVCRQNTKVYISENSEVDSLAHTENFSDGLIDEIDSQNLSEPENLENISFPETATLEPQTLADQGNDAATKRQQTATNGNKRQHLENSESHDSDIKPESELTENENQLLTMIQTAVVENHAYTAHQIRDILTSECKASRADRKKVWGALGDAEQKIFTELLAVEISAEVGHVLEAMQQILGSSDDPNEIDHLYRVFASELIDRGVELLRVDDKQKISRWIGIRDLAAGLLEAAWDGHDAVYECAASHFYGEEVPAAIARLEYLKEWAAVEQIRDALS